MSEDLGSVYKIRDYRDSDKSFIMATYLRGLYYGDSWFSVIPKKIFMEHYKLIIEAILKKNTVKIACLIDEEDVILGYSILSDDFNTLHWIFVKLAFRNKGIGKSLCPSHPTYVSHLTALGKNLLPKLNGAVFNPFSL